MKTSVHTINNLINFELPPVDELVQRINEQLGKVEEIVELDEKYKDIVIVKVVSAEKHPNADKLTICMVDDDGVVQDVPRDENGHVQVVCGAPNAREGIFAVWLPPKVTVPASAGDKEPFVLAAREIRGVLSQGMLAAPDELAIGTGHDGIVELTDEDLPPNMQERTVRSGMDFAETFGLNDTILDIENKMFTHRPDCFGQLGVAREIAGIFGHRFESPEWYTRIPEFEGSEELQLTVANDAGEKVPRFMAVALKDVSVKSSPFWLQAELVRLGSKPINNIVDITNYVMLMSAQPMHAYDYDRLEGATLGVRMADSGEELSLLNGKTYKLTPDDIVIADGQRAIGLGGVMGGSNSEVSADTKNIVLECATFDMYAIRKTSMRHGLFTDAVTRFNKGQSPRQNDRVLNFAMRSVMEMADGRQASAVFDSNDTVKDWYLGDSTVHLEYPVRTTAQFVNDRLGLTLGVTEQATLLENVDIRVNGSRESDEMEIHLPFWRTDIEQPEDIVEEVGRLYGFDKIPRELPQRSIRPIAKNQQREVAQLIRESLARSGSNEVLTYSFVHKNTMERAEQDVSQAFQLGNALSPDLQYYRLSVLPSLLEKVHPNIKNGYDEFVLFEVGKAHNKKYHADDDEGLPKELAMVDAVYASKKSHDGAAYFKMRRLLGQLARDLGFTLKFSPVTEALDYPLTAPFDLERSALVESRRGQFIGIVGELKQSVYRNFKLPDYVAAFSLDLAGFCAAVAEAGNAYMPLSKFPKVTQDISLKVSSDTAYETLFWTAYTSAKQAEPGQCDLKLEPLSLYQAPEDTAHKTVTLRLTIASHETTLTDKEVAKVMDAVARSTQKELGAERI